MGDHVIRRAVASDVPALRRFKCENAGEYWTRQLQQTIRSGVCDAIVEPIDSTDVLVAVLDGTVVGIVVCGSVDVGVRVIDVLAVTHAYRRKGIGTTLKVHALAFSAARSTTRIISYVNKKNAPMRALNDKLGVAAADDPEDVDQIFSVATLEVEEIDVGGFVMRVT